MEKTYTTMQVAKMFGKEPKEITARIKKGGIKGVTVSETDEGFTYILSDTTVNQLGALYGLVPKYEAAEESKLTSMYNIDGKAFKEALTKSGYSAAVVSKAIGKADHYVSNCCDRNRMNVDAASEIQRIFGIDATKYIHKEEPKEEPKVEQVVDHKDIGETMRGAVYNGMIDAILMTLKEDTIRKMMIRILEDEQVQNIFQKVLFRAIDGANNKGRSHAGLIPQNGVKR